MARTSTRTKKKSRVVSIDFSNAEVRKLADEGPQPCEVVEVTQESGEKAEYFAWKFKVIEGDSEGATIYNNTSLKEDALWNLRGLLMAMGLEVPQDAIDVDLDELIGLKVMLHVEHEEWDGRPRARVVDYSEYVEEDAKPAKRGKKVEEEEEDEDEAPAKKPTRAEKRRAAKAAAEEEDEEEEEKPARGKAGTSKAGAGKSKKKQGVSEDEIGDMDQEELADLVEEHDLDVDLDSIKSLRRMRTTVVEAMMEAGLIDD